LRLIRALHNLGCKVRQRLLLGRAKSWTLIATISKELAQKRVETEQCRQHQCAAVAILNVGGMHYRMQQQPYRIDEDMALLSLDLFSRVVAIRINAAPPFSALFTLWLSIMHAVGLASRPMASRHRT
jgi:hypothetical protein